MLVHSTKQIWPLFRCSGLSVENKQEEFSLGFGKICNILKNEQQIVVCNYYSTTILCKLGDRICFLLCYSSCKPIQSS